ncbi:unnamed protein product [Chrysodeixis includens]|uniref:Uncharacterized protein n=1 Tax=Chrysodeixis includens TaxID=689277 RepID=A0A9P0GW66_CHRIL|nr:unnamed protein product [Chrysodeixis includens]
MNRNLRRARASRRNESPNRFNISKQKCASDNEEAFSPRRKEDKLVANRCCYVSPVQKDFGQSTGSTSPLIPTCDAETADQSFYREFKAEKLARDQFSPETINQLKELKKVLCGNAPKVENSSQYVPQRMSMAADFIETTDGFQWQNVDDIEEIENLILHDSKESPSHFERLPVNTRISDVPRVKIIAEKFSKYKRNNLELRRLDEKVVCVEYDIYEQSHDERNPKPVQRMRAFFSIKPVFDKGGEQNGTTPKLPSGIKQKFDIVDEDLEKMTNKEIEIIDGKIDENQSYLDDLRRILKRKKIINAKKNKTSLDLQSLYEMAKKDRSPLDCDFSDANLLSKAELQEVKDLILQRCSSSAQGISRRRVKGKDRGSAVEVGVISESIVAELLREDATIDVLQ